MQVPISVAFASLCQDEVLFGGKGKLFGCEAGQLKVRPHEFGKKTAINFEFAADCRRVAVISEYRMQIYVEVCAVPGF